MNERKGNKERMEQNRNLTNHPPEERRRERRKNGKGKKTSERGKKERRSEGPPKMYCAHIALD